VAAEEAIRALQLFVARERELERIRELVLEAFELAPGAKVKRSEVYAHVAERLRRPRSNALCLAVRSALSELPVMESVSDGRSRFIGLRRRGEAASREPEGSSVTRRALVKEFSSALADPAQ